MGVIHNQIIGKVNREKVAAYKIGKGCMDCGNKHPAVLHFHHPNGKPNKNRRTNLHTRPYRLTWKWDTVQAELDKLEVLCANCHAIRHYNERKSQ